MLQVPFILERRDQLVLVHHDSVLSQTLRAICGSGCVVIAFVVVSVSADYIFPAQCDACTRSFEHIPSFTTVPLHVPEGCPPAKHNANGTHVVGGVVLRVNLVTSVVGYVVIELQDASGNALEGFSLEMSDQLVR